MSPVADEETDALAQEIISKIADKLEGIGGI